MAPTIGQIVRGAREEALLSTEELAREAVVDLAELVSLEADSQPASTAAIDRVARVLGLDPIGLMQGQRRRQGSPSLFFRQGPWSDFNDLDSARMDAALQQAIRLVEVNRILGRTSRRSSIPSVAIRWAAPHRDGYDLARKLRRTLDNDDRPLGELWTLLEDEFDILVEALPLETKSILAATIKESVRGGGAAIVVNTRHEWHTNPLVLPVTLAHELSHVLYDKPNGQVNVVIDGDEWKGPPQLEQRARAFAAELLIPLAGLRRLLGMEDRSMSLAEAERRVGLVQREFATPREIVVNQLQNQGFLVEDRDFREALLRGPTVVGGVIRTNARASVLERRVAEARQRHLITDGRARELLGLSAWDELPPQS